MKKIFKNFTFSFKTNIKTILTAVVTSAVIWFAISLQIFPDITITIKDIPVRINPPQYMIENNLSLTEGYQFTASAQVRGKRYDVGRLDSGDFDAVLNLSNVTEEGDYDVDIIVSSNSPISFEIQPLSQTERIRVERIESRTFEMDDPNFPLIIKADAIWLAEGMQIDDTGLTANPPTLTIRGEKSIIDSITRAEVHAIHDEEMFATLSVEGELRLFNSDNVWVSNPDVILTSTNFTVTVPVHRVRTLPLNFVITGAPSNFDLSGLRSRTDLMPTELTLSSPDMSIDYLPAFDVGEIPLNEIDMQILLLGIRDTFSPKLPEGYRNISGNASFSLQFKDVEDYAQYDFPIERENITIMNAPEGFNVEILTRVLTVTVIGPASYVQAMSVHDINVTLNLVSMPEIIENSRIDSRTVQCRLVGTRVPAWVVGYPQVDVSFTKAD